MATISLPQRWAVDAVLVAVLVQRAGAADAEVGLQRPRGVVDALVDDAAVVAGLVRGDPGLALQHDHLAPRHPVQELTGDGQPEDAAADNGKIAIAVGAGHAALVTAPNRKESNVATTWSIIASVRPG